MVAGDSNSAFFHAAASARRKVNWIGSILGDGNEEISGLPRIQESFISHLLRFWGTDRGPAQLILPELPGPSLSPLGYAQYWSVRSGDFGGHAQSSVGEGAWL